MRIRHSVSNETVKAIPSLPYLSNQKRNNFIQDYVRTHGNFMLQDPVDLYDLNIDITPIGQRSRNSILYLHLYGTKGEYFIREYTVFLSYETIPFSYHPQGHDFPYDDGVKIEKFGFSCDEGTMQIAFVSKDLTEENRVELLK